MRWIESAGLATPWFFVGLFLAASFLMIWRLESMAADGMEGTVLGTLIMPYCTGMGNLIFAIVLGMKGGSGAEVLTNCLVNNVTNLTLLVGLPAALWGMAVLPAKAGKREEPDYSHHLNRLSMMLTLFAVLFFTGTAVGLGPIVRVDHRPVGGGTIGSVTRGLQQLYFDATRGHLSTYRNWLAPVYQSRPRNGQERISLVGMSAD